MARTEQSTREIMMLHIGEPLSAVISSSAPATPAEAALTVAEGRSYAVPADWFAGVQYPRGRSGTAASTVAQASNQTVTLIQKLV